MNPNAFVLFNTYRAGKLVTDKKYDPAEQFLNDALAVNPNNFDSYNVLSKIKKEQGNTSEATSAIEKAIALAKQQNARQWQINELLETQEGINKKP